MPGYWSKSGPGREPMIKETEVLVVGGGPAGLLAAIRAARMGARVILLEKNKQPGKKLRITGKGRCNVTNTGDVNSFIRQYGGQGAFLFGAFSRFFHPDIRRLLAEAGVETKEERGGRVFPAADQAYLVAEALERLAAEAGAQIITGCRARDLIILPVGTDQAPQTLGGASGKAPGPMGKAAGAYIDDPWDASEIRAEAVVLATGGLSYPATGSTGDGYAWATAAGHRITELKPALVPLESPDRWVSDLSGLTLRNVKASLWNEGAKADGRGKLAEFQGEMLFTYFGLSGPIILSLSRYYPTDSRTNVQIHLDLKPALSAEVLDKRLLRDFQKYQKKLLPNAMTELLPRALIPVVIESAGLGETRPAAELTRAERLRLGGTLKALPVRISGTRPMEEAIVTAGGVALNEIDPKTMSSKKTAGLYIAGELLDLDGLTGGYNLQAAFSTGWVAGENAARQAGYTI